MIETVGLEEVVIASLTALHTAHTLASIERGIHVLCEKPVTNDINLLCRTNLSFSISWSCKHKFLSHQPSCLSSRGSLRRHNPTPGIKVIVGFVRRFDENYQYVRENVQAGEIASPIVIRSQACEKMDETGFFVQYAQVSVVSLWIPRSKTLM